ncbi:MAG: hypothetical protein OXH75_17675 [Acidobacteria bacterium]|nr:hypothetical protein [Acidobacteriota bacterium]
MTRKFNIDDEQLIWSEGVSASADSVFGQDGLLAIMAAAELGLPDVLDRPAALQNTEDETQVLRLASMPNERWQEVSDRLIEENAYRLTLVSLFGTEKVANPATTTEKKLIRISRGEDVEMGTDPTTDATPNQSLDYTDQVVTLPWFWRRYQFPIGHMEGDFGYVESVMSDGVGALTYKLENVAAGGAGKFLGRSIQGLKQLPATNRKATSNDWNGASTTGPQRLANIKTARKKLTADGFSAQGLTLVLNPEDNTELIEDYSDNYQGSQAERLGRVVPGGIQESDALKGGDAAYLLPGGSMVWCDAYMPRAITWTHPSGLSQVVLCVAKGAPGIRSTYSGKVGAYLQTAS